MRRRCGIPHVQGSATGVSVAFGEEPVIFAMLRAGLFLAEGMWESFPTASLVLQPGHGAPVVALPAATGPLVIVDAVINSGKSVRDLLSALQLAGRRPVVVATLVGFRPTMESLCVEYPAVEFVAARISDRSYVGNGSTDTGSRLFGTTSWAAERSP
jgi:uracil phosphoribosyltransferase